MGNQNQTRNNTHNDPPPVYMVDGDKVVTLNRDQAERMEMLLITKTANRKEA